METRYLIFQDQSAVNDILEGFYFKVWNRKDKFLLKSFTNRSQCLKHFKALGKKFGSKFTFEILTIGELK